MKKFICGIALGTLLFLCACQQNVENKEIPLSIGTQNVTASFTGTLKDGKPLGEGSFTVKAEQGEWLFKGNFENGIISGVGTLTNYPITVNFSNTEYSGLYSGEAVNGIPEGKGNFICIIDEKSVSYEGAWKDSKPYEQGYLKSTDFAINFSEITRTGAYEGETLNGIANGIGVFTATNDEGNTYKYSGEWRDNTFNGKGERTFTNTDEIADEIGDFINGDFIPVKSDYLRSLGTDKNLLYSLSEQNKLFIDEHDVLFPTADAAQLNDYLSSSLSYETFTKKPSEFQGQIMDAGPKQVIQIFESDIVGSNFDTLTIALVTNDSYDKIYYLYYFGKLDDIYVGDTINIKGLPIAFTTFKNTGGGDTWCIVMVGCSVSK